VAWRLKAQLYALLVPSYVFLLIVPGALSYTYKLRNPDGQTAVIHTGKSRIMPYWSILGRYLVGEGKWMLVGTKLFSCVILYLMLRTQTRDDYDLQLPYFIYSLALFGHGVLLYRCRVLETTRTLWYRALPVPHYL